MKLLLYIRPNTTPFQHRLMNLLTDNISEYHIDIRFITNIETIITILYLLSINIIYNIILIIYI